jgi:CubicO group peptidase (beta-lactamase class C family)
MTAANWRMRPWSEWAFGNAAAFLPGLESAPASSPAPLPRKLREPGTAWRAVEADPWTAASIAVAGGAVIHEHYSPGMAADRPHMLFSITKSVVGLAAERLIASGRLDETARVDSIVRELAGSAWAAASVRALLDMTDGVAFDEDYARADAAIHRYSAAYWGEQSGGVRPLLTAMQSQAPTAGDPAFRYRTPVADVIAWVLERIDGTLLDALIGELIWTPIGAGHAAYHVVDTGGVPIGGTGFNATLSDVARLGLALLPGGALGDLTQRLLEGGDRAAFARSPQAATRPGWSYRSFWWVRHDPPALAALGVYGQRLWIDPVRGVVAARLSARPAASNTDADLAAWAAFDSLG